MGRTLESLFDVHVRFGEFVDYEPEVLRDDSVGEVPVLCNKEVQLRFGRRVKEDREGDDLMTPFTDQ